MPGGRHHVAQPAQPAPVNMVLDGSLWYCSGLMVTVGRCHVSPRQRAAATAIAALVVVFTWQPVAAGDATSAGGMDAAFAVDLELPEDALDGDVVLAGAIVPATPIAPGQGPLVDDLGGRWDEQRPAGRTPFWYARTLSAAWVPKDGANGFGNTDVPITTSFVPVWFDDLPALIVTPGFGFHFWQPPDDLILPSTVFDSYIDVSWRTPVTERWGLAFGITPGVYGDYKAFNSRAFQLTGWGLVDVAVTKTWTLLAGAAVVRQLDLRVLPVGGLVWTPNEANRLELLVPRSRFARRIRAFEGGGAAWTYAACQFGGGTWAIALPDETTAVVTSSDLRAILGIEWFRSRTVAGVAEVGYVFARTISANGVAEFNPTDAIMLQLGATF